MSDKSNKEKHSTLDRLLLDEYVLVHINSKLDGIVLPSHLLNQFSVTLKLSRYFRGALDIKEEIIEAELLFGETYFNCTIPFNAIWGVTSIKGNNVIWPEDTPEEIMNTLMKAGDKASLESPDLNPNPSSLPGSSVPAPAGFPLGGNITPIGTKATAKRRDHLKRVK